MQRGIIAPPGAMHVTDAGDISGRQLTTQEINYLALYWDKVVIPTSNVVHITLPEEETLLQSGIFTRPKTVVAGKMNFGEMLRIMLSTQASMAEFLINEDKETDCVLHQLGQYIILPREKTHESLSVRVELINLLPVPEEDVHIAEIVDFKHRRSAELTALHQYLDEAYLEILKSPDPSLSEKIAIDRLKKAIEDLDRVSKERWKINRKFDFSAELNIEGSKVLTGAAAGAAFDFYSAGGLTLPLGAVLGALASLIKISAKPILSFEPAKNNLKFGYLSHACQEGLVQPPIKK